MEFLRRSRLATTLMGAGVVVALVAVVLMVRARSGTHQDESVTTSNSPDTSTGGLLVPATPRNTKQSKQSKHGKLPAAVPSANAPLQPAGTGPGATLPGMGGSGWASTQPRHHVVLTVTASEDLPTAVGWKVPTSPGVRGGSTRYNGRSWSHSSIAYGAPDYAELYVFSGPAGRGITCTITVDGHVADRRTTEGPFGSVMCQG